MAGADRSSRARRYQRQPMGYRAFLPATLPPDPPVRLDGELQSLLSQGGGPCGLSLRRTRFFSPAPHAIGA